MEDAIYFDGPYRPRHHLQENELINSQSSGYSSTDVTGVGGGGKLPLPRPESWTSTSDQGSVVHNYSYYNCMVHQHVSPRGSFHQQHFADDCYSPKEELFHHMRRANTEGCLYEPMRSPTIISPGNQKIMENHMPALLEGIDPLILLPYLHKHRLVSRDDADEISHPNRTKLQRNLRIIYSAPYKDSGAFERFVTSLEEAEEHPCHRELARLLQEGNRQLRKPDELCSDGSLYKSKGMRKRGRPKQYLSTPNLELASDVETDSTLHSKPSTKSRGTPFGILQSRKFSSRPDDVVSGMKMDNGVKGATMHGLTEDAVTSYCLMEKLKWLQDNVKFRGCKEEIILTSKTNYLTERRIRHSGIVFQNGNPKVAVLCSDLLLLLKPARDVHWEDDNGAKSQEPSMFEWFSNNKYNAKKPLLLKFLEVSEQTEEKCSFKLYYRPGDLELILTTSAEAARDFWIKMIGYSIEDCKRASLEYFALPMHNEESHTPSGEPFWKIRLTLMDAINLKLPHLPDGDNHHLLCTVRLGQRMMHRTPTAVGKDRVAWSYKMEFSEFATSDIIHITVIEENLFRPNESVGSVQIPVSKIPLTLHELDMDFPIKRAKHTCGKIRVQLGMGREINV